MRVKRGLFTIVITVFEREWCLPYSLQSLAWQNDQNFEILIYGDGVSAGTSRILESVAKLPQLKNKLQYVEFLRRPGYWGNHLRQAGLAAARGEFVSFLSHDTIYHPDFCQVHVERLRLQPCISVTKAAYWHRDDGARESVYVGIWPTQAPGIATVGGIDAHCLAYPTDFLREHVKFEQILTEYAADFWIFEQCRTQLPIVYDAADLRTLAAHM